MQLTHQAICSRAAAGSDSGDSPMGGWGWAVFAPTGRAETETRPKGGRAQYRSKMLHATSGAREHDSGQLERRPVAPPLAAQLRQGSANWQSALSQCLLSASVRDALGPSFIV